MALERKKAMIIASGLVISMLFIFALICGLGYNKAGNVIKSFEEDFKKVSATAQFKFITNNLNKTKLGDFASIKGKKVFELPFSSYDSAKSLIKALDDKKIEKVQVYTNIYIDETIQIDASKFINIVGEIGFLVKIGFWFKGKTAIRSICAISSFIYKAIKEDSKEREKVFVILNLEDEKNVKGFYVKTDNDGKIKTICSPKTFKFNDSKNGLEGKSHDFVAFIVEKVRKASNSTAD
ncbi:hypothetical protein CWI39_3080p0010 [Hamiltosporidium magnivora]|uniref:Uncharacterized protein n=2 Tax=Hamiltosporidium magnivora TaxID=148818 RepID=A0A4Q9KRW1_9MICR|nr:hypothetical protein CWI39_3080p0010 [Hamiltosporidium magnivora]